MLLKINFGSRKGEIQDVAPEAGRALLADGRATWPTPDQNPAQAAGDSKAPGKPRGRQQRKER
jgi:hypothetical protein